MENVRKRRATGQKYLEYMEEYISGRRKIRETGTIESRFWSKVDKKYGPIHKDVGRCWIWVGNVFPSGYGQLSAKGIGEIMAHRISWVLNKGDIPDGLQVLHKCDNPPCVNPSHLFLGTHADNMRDMVEKGRGKFGKGEESPRARLTDRDVLAIRQLAKTRVVSQQQMANIYGVSLENISKIVRRITWKHI